MPTPLDRAAKALWEATRDVHGMSWLKLTKEQQAVLREAVPVAMSICLEWYDISKPPPPDRSVLVRHKDAVGEVYDVAVFIGRQPDGELRWITSDAYLESRQLTHWTYLPPFTDPSRPARSIGG